MMEPNRLLIQAALKTGLRTSDRAQRNHPSLVTCRNFHPSEYGLSALELITPVVNNTVFSAGTNWPSPQVFRTRTNTFLFDRTALYTVDETTWAITAVSVYPPGSGTPTTISTGGVWQIADFQGAWVATNGVCVLYKRADDSLVRCVVTVIRALCAHQQRLFIGGMDTVWSSSWQTLVGNWITDAPAGFSETLTMPSNLVWWSNVGSLALFWLLLDPTLAEEGDLNTHTSSRMFVTEMMARGDWGFAPATFRGRCLALKTLGAAVVAYGEDGVTKFSPITAPKPTCSITELSAVGCHGRGAIAGTPERHLWVDTSRALWEVVPTASPQRLDMQEYGEMFGANIIGTHDPERGTLFLSDGSLTLIRTDTGMAQISQCPTSLIHAFGKLRGVVQDGPEGAQPAELVMNCYDFSLRGLKTVLEVRVAGTVPDDCTVSVEYREPNSTEWLRDTDRSLNEDGVAEIFCTAAEFRIVLLCPSWEGASIDYIEVTWKPFDQKHRSKAPRLVEA